MRALPNLPGQLDLFSIVGGRCNYRCAVCGEMGVTEPDKGCGDCASPSGSTDPAPDARMQAASKPRAFKPAAAKRASKPARTVKRTAGAKRSTAPSGARGAAAGGER